MPYLSNKQLGFRKQDSKACQLAHLVKQWGEAVDSFHYVAVILLDLRNVFHRVFHAGRFKIGLNFLQLVFPAKPRWSEKTF